MDSAREAADTIAERMRALDAVPDGRTDTVAATTSVPAAPAGLIGTTDIVDIIADRIYATVDTARTIHDEVDAVDPSTADLLHAIITDLEKHRMDAQVGRRQSLKRSAQTCCITISSRLRR